jgi:hypothetical protein
MGPDFVCLTFGASLHIAGHKPFHPRPVEVPFSKFVRPQSSRVSNCWKVVMYPHGFASEVAVVGDVKTPFKGQCSVLVVPVGKAIPDCHVV